MCYRYWRMPFQSSITSGSINSSWGHKSIQYPLLTLPSQKKIVILWKFNLFWCHGSCKPLPVAKSQYASCQPNTAPIGIQLSILESQGLTWNSTWTHNPLLTTVIQRPTIFFAIEKIKLWWLSWTESIGLDRFGASLTWVCGPCWLGVLTGWVIWRNRLLQQFHAFQSRNISFTISAPHLPICWL